MTSLELLNLITNGGPMAILAVAIWALLTGRLVPRWTHEAALAQKEAELAEVTRREAELWQLLKRTAGWVDAAAIVAERATTVATQAASVASVAAGGKAQTRGPNWIDTEAHTRRPYRRRATDPPP